METDSRKIIRRLKAESLSWCRFLDHTTSFARAKKVVIVPHPKKDLPLGTARNIAAMAGWL